ncbi:MAG: cupin domain-containing protein [Alphaproteobacteria bacterium]
MPAESARPAAVPTRQVDNERVCVTEWRFAPGAATGWHRHAHDYVVVPLMDGQLLLKQPDGSETIADLKAGVSYFRQTGVEHDVINASGHEFAFVEIEMK